MSDLTHARDGSTIYIDAKGLEDALLELGGGTEAKAEKALKTAVTRTARWASAQLRKKTAKLIRVSARVMKGRVGLYFNDGTARLWFGLWDVDLKRMGARQTSSGVVAGPVSRKGAFIVKSIGGHVFERKGSARLPIVRSPGVPIEKEGREAMESIAKEIEPRILEEFTRAFQFAK